MLTQVLRQFHETRVDQIYHHAITTPWRVLGLRMEETASKYEG
jgi:hypothetical protein